MGQRGKRFVDLSQVIDHMQPVANPQYNQKPAMWYRITHETSRGMYKHGTITFQIRDFLIGEHVSTHVDALRHYIPDGPDLAEMPLDWFITSAICVDVSHKPPLSFITAADLEQAMHAAHLEIRAGDTFLYYQGYYRRSGTPNWLHEFAGLDGGAVEWLADQGVINIGCECASIDNAITMQEESRPSYPAHTACRERRIINTENLCNLDAVLGQRFTYVGLPLKLRGGTGCPIRAVAILDE